MILIFKNNNYELTTNSTDLGVTDKQFSKTSTDLSTFFVKTHIEGSTCSYPQDIKSLFPRWLRMENDGNTVLISLTEKYYEWLTCGSDDITDVGFFNLEDLTNFENIPKSLLHHLTYSYINALPETSITGDLISREGIIRLVSNIKTNLYSKKGTEDSIKLLISAAFDYDTDTISVSYPKRYVLNLNSGNFNFNFIGNDVGYDTDKYEGYASTYIDLNSSILNFSVLPDGDIWQEYSYVVNCAELTKEQYEGVVRPIVHPAGFRDVLNYNSELFNEINDSLSVLTIYEIPKIKNYTGYTLGSTTTIGSTFGCISGLTAPTYVFPTWDVEISAYPSGVSFGKIILSDFFKLLPNSGYTFPNELFTCDT